MEELHTVTTPIEEAPIKETPAAEALLAQIRDSLELQNKQAKRQIRLLRVCLVAVSLIALVSILCAASVLPMITQTLTDIDATVNAIDMKQIDALIQGGSEAVVAMNDALAHINALDFASLNTTIQNLETTIVGLSNMDIDMLNAAIKNLNSTVEPLAAFMEKFKR